jgi:hypothetical protein
VIDHFPIERVILLADEQSDTRFLDQQIHDAWGNMTMGSPNSGAAPRLAVVAITDYFHRSTSTSRNGSTSETVRLVSRLSDSRRVFAMVQHRVEETAAVAS